MIEIILLKAWPYVLGVLALVAGWFTAKRQGKIEEQRNALARSRQQADKAAKEARDATNNVSQMDDDALLGRARDKWVRK